MILFLSQNENELLKDFAVKLTQKTGIKTIFNSMSELYKNGEITISSINNRFNTSINGIDFSKIKLCYINSNVSFYANMFDFETKEDNEYAYQEWNAALLCLLNINENTKFINPHLKKYDCNMEIENTLLFQKLGLDTVEMFLTNNSENLLTLYEIYNYNLTIKNILSENKKEKLFEKNDLKKLDKLHLSPYVFKRPENGCLIEILILGDNIIAVDTEQKKEVNLPLGLKERLVLLKNELNDTILRCSAIFNGEKYYFCGLNQTPEVEEIKTLLNDKFEDVFTAFLLEEYSK